MELEYEYVSKNSNREAQLKPVYVCQDDYTEMLTMKKQSSYVDIEISKQKKEAKDNKNSSTNHVKFCDKFKTGVIICTVINVVMIIVASLTLALIIAQYSNYRKTE